MRPSLVVKACSGMLFVATLLLAFHANAAIDNSGLLSNVVDKYQLAATAWANVITGAATRLFWTLVLISMIWTFGFMILRKADIGEFFAELLRFILFTGLFWWALTNGPSFASSIINSLKQLGGQATGLGGLAPSGIVDIGFQIFGTVVERSSIWNPVLSVAGIIIAAIILVILALISINMVMLLVSGWILAYGGIFFLGFGGARWTSDIAINYYKTVLGVGAALLTMVLLVGIGKTFLDDYYSRMSSAMPLSEMGVMLVVAVVLLVLTNKLPSLVAGIITGASVGGAAAMGNFGAGTVLAAGGVAAAAAATGGAVLVAGAANAAGGAQAVTAAIRKAGQNMQSGGGRFFGRAAGDGSEAAAGGGSGGPSGNSGGGSPLAAAMGNVANFDSFSSKASAGASDGSSKNDNQGKTGGAFRGALTTAAKFSADVGANLAQGAQAVAKQKGGSFKQAVQGRIDETLGGKVAAAIRSGRQTPAPEYLFDNNSLASSEVDAASEVAAFRDSPSRS